MRHKFSHLMTQSCEVLMLQFPKRTWDDKHEDGGSFHCTIPCYGKHSGPKSSNFQSYLPKYNKFPGEIQMFYSKFKPLINRITLACLLIPIFFLLSLSPSPSLSLSPSPPPLPFPPFSHDSSKMFKYFHCSRDLFVKNLFSKREDRDTSFSKIHVHSIIFRRM